MSNSDVEGVRKMEVTRPQITKEQSDLAFEFLRCLFDEDVDGYWETISKVDKARLYGMYRHYVNVSDSSDYSFRDYLIQEIMPGHTENYEKLRGNSPGISTTLRYSDEGEALIYLFEAVTQSRIIEKESYEYVFPLTLTIDTEYSRGDISHSWKVRAYSDKLYEKLD